MLNKLLFKTVFFFLAVSFAYGQEVQIVEQINAIGKQKEKRFELIEHSFPLAVHQKLGVLKGSFPNSDNQKVIKLFNLLWKHANNLDANSFVVEEVQPSNDSTVIILSLYNLDEEELTKNDGLYLHNMVYMIGALTNAKEGKSFRLNETKISLQPMHYIAYQNEAGKEATVAVGGLLGAKTWIRGKEGRQPIFYSLSGFGVGPGIVSPASLSFNAGRLNPVPQNFGQFLLKILSEQKL